MDDDSWQVVKNTSHVINFVGSNKEGRHRTRSWSSTTAAKSVRSRTHLKQTTEQEPVLKIDMSAGDKIIVLSGPFKDFEGEVEVSPERTSLRHYSLSLDAIRQWS